MDGRRQDHWSTSLDAIDKLHARIEQHGVEDDDPITRNLMAQVAHAKSSSFIALLDRDSRLLDVNPAALISGGIDRAEVVGLPLWATPWWAGAAPDALDAFRAAIGTVAAGGFARFDVDVWIEAGGQTRGTLDLVLRPLRGRDGIVAFIVAEGRSITDRKRVERHLERQNAELSALTKRLARIHDYRERLLAELSHDLRAPLQVVVTRAEQLLRLVTDQELQGPVVGMRVAALGALEQINDMLDQVRADHGESRLSMVEADLAQAVRTVAEQFEPLATDRAVVLDLRTPSQLTSRFDVERVSRVVANLLANAIRHTPVGGRVRCELAAGDAVSVLEIADSGPGVPLDHRDEVFGRFRSGLSGDGRTASVGAGLGLAIVREFVELHGGDVSLGDAPEGGALFTVRLPVRPVDGAPRPTLSQMAAAAQHMEYARSHLEVELAGGSALAAAPTVVVVESVPARAETIVDRVGDSAVVCVAVDALEALRLTADLRPAVVLVGTTTGDMPPTSLLRRIASDVRLIDVRRVALAGERSHDPSPDALIDAGAEIVLPSTAVDDLDTNFWAAVTAIRR